MRNTETHDVLKQANAFIAAEEEYLPLPQMDGTDETSAGRTLLHHNSASANAPPLVTWHLTLAGRSKNNGCAHISPLRPFCNSTKFPQKLAATRIAITGTAACARLTLWATRVAQSKRACWEKEGRPVPGTDLQEIQANLVKLAAWRQIAQDPTGFASSLQVCPGTAAELAATLREQLQVDRLPSSVRIACAADNQRLTATSVPEKPAMWSFHALYESSVCLSPNDSRLQKPMLGGYDPAHSQWLSTTLHADLAKSVTTAEITIPQWQSSTQDSPLAPDPARVWIAEDQNGNWRLIAVSGPAQSWGHVSSDDAGHVNSRRPSRFFPPEFRWTDSNKLKTNGLWFEAKIV